MQLVLSCAPVSKLKPLHEEKQLALSYTQVSKLKLWEKSNLLSAMHK